MFVDKDSITINGINMGQYLVEAKYGFNKLWSQDSGRNLAGRMTGTLIGIFPKLTLQFRKLTKSELETIAPMLDSESQTLSYYDPKLHRQNTITTYTGDWEIINKKIINGNGKNEGFSCAFISGARR